MSWMSLVSLLTLATLSLPSSAEQKRRDPLPESFTATAQYLGDGGGAATTLKMRVERYTPDAKKKLEAIIARSAGGDVMLPETVGLEVKAPGGSSWVSATSPEAAKIMTPRFPGGDLEIVLP